MMATNNSFSVCEYCDHEELEAENKRLREALEHIKEYWNGNPESAVDAIEEAIHTAEEALEGGGE